MLNFVPQINFAPVDEGGRRGGVKSPEVATEVDVTAQSAWELVQEDEYAEKRKWLVGILTHLGIPQDRVTINKEGIITIHNDEGREFRLQKIVPFLPPDVHPFSNFTDEELLSIADIFQFQISDNKITRIGRHSTYSELFWDIFWCREDTVLKWKWTLAIFYKKWNWVMIDRYHCVDLTYAYIPTS